MKALEEALKPLSSSGPPLLAALAKIVPEPAERDALSAAIVAALAEQASRAATTAGGKENAAATAAASSAPPANHPQQQQTLPPLEGAAAVMRSLSVIQPWGSFDVAFFPSDKLVLRAAQKARGAGGDAVASANAKELVVPISSVRAVAVLDRVPEEQATFVLLGLKPAVSLPWASGGGATAAAAASALECLALRIPNSAPRELLSFSNPSGGSVGAEGEGGDVGPPEVIEGNRAVVLCAALGRAGVPPSAFLSPDPATFSSASGGIGGKGGGCSVRAAVKASQGHLFPLGERAVAFVKKPAYLVSLKAVRAAELARAGGGSASFDLLLHLRPPPTTTAAGGGAAGGGAAGGGAAGGEGKAAPTPPALPRVLEFGQIPTQELAPLRKWLEDRGVPLGASSEGVGGGSRRGGDDDEADSDEDESSSSDEDDEDFDPKAAARALKAEEEEEDESESGSDEDDGGRPSKKYKF